MDEPSWLAFPSPSGRCGLALFGFWKMFGAGCFPWQVAWCNNSARSFTLCAFLCISRRAASCWACLPWSSCQLVNAFEFFWRLTPMALHVLQVISFSHAFTRSCDSLGRSAWRSTSASCLMLCCCSLLLAGGRKKRAARHPRREFAGLGVVISHRMAPCWVCCTMGFFALWLRVRGRSDPGRVGRSKVSRPSWQ